MIYITGDTHGCLPDGFMSVDGFSRRLNSDSFPEQKAMTKEDYIIIAGDFAGVFEVTETKEENNWLTWLDKKPWTTLVVDGNHENFDRLEAFPEVDYRGGRAHQIRESVFHLMRGHIFEIGGKSIWTFGGARSHDIEGGILRREDFASPRSFNREKKRLMNEGVHFRVEHESWWEREFATEEEMERGREALKKRGSQVDYLVTHCGPASAVRAIRGEGYEPDAMERYFDEIAATTQFSMWFFGHYHVNRKIGEKYLCLYEQVIRIG